MALLPVALDYWISDAGLVWKSDQVTSPSDEMVLHCKQWLEAYAKPRKTVNRKVASYSLKHLIEAEYGYVTNGAFIVAALELGYDVLPCHLGSSNAWFNFTVEE